MNVALRETLAPRPYLGEGRPKECRGGADELREQAVDVPEPSRERGAALCDHECA